MMEGLKFSHPKTFCQYKQPFYEQFIVTLIKLKIIAMERDIAGDVKTVLFSYYFTVR